MILRLRLAEVLDQHREPRRGRVTRIAAATGIDRHLVAGMLKGKTKTIKLSTLSKLCRYLASTYHISPACLPAILFAWERGEFWDLFRERKHILSCVAVRGSLASGPLRVVTESDTDLNDVFTSQIAGLGDAPPPVRPLRVTGYGRLTDAEKKSKERKAARSDAERAYQESNGQHTALAAIGSPKSNGVTELILAKTFGAVAFRPERVTDVVSRRCPLFYRYRPSDADPPSSVGGMRLGSALAYQSLEPGIYYEKADRSWQCCPCTDAADAALVFYAEYPQESRVEVVLGGFSARATYALAGLLNERDFGMKLWPPLFCSSNLRCGAFIVTFTFAERRANGGDVDYPHMEGYDVVPVPRLSLRRRLKEH